MPEIIDKTLKEFYEEDRRRALQYVPEWRPVENGDFGLALLRIFSHMREEIASRINRVPDKNFSAFLSLVGTGLFPAKPARVPVTFYPAEGYYQDIFMPARTQVTTEQTESHGILTYEVSRGISITRAKLDEVVSVNPKRDEIFCHTENMAEKRVIKPFQGEDLQEHVLFLAEKNLFHLANGGKITLEFEFKLDPASQNADMNDFSWHCLTETGRTEIFASEIKPNGNKSSITLDIPARELQEEEIFGQKSIWISCRPKVDIKAASKMNIVSIKIARVSGKTQADLGFFNFTPIDLQANKIFYPFGRTPRATDAFYIASREVFSKRDSKASVVFKRTIPYSPEQKPAEGQIIELSFEYWNGSLWKPIAECDDKDDKTNKFLTAGSSLTYQGSFEFIVPSDIEEINVGGEKNFWIRIVLAKGDYGREKLPDAKVGDTIIWDIDYTRIHPPSLNSIELTHWTTKDSSSLEKCLAKNNLEYTDLSLKCNGSEIFAPFCQIKEQSSSIYLGFDGNLGRGNLSIFFSLAKDSVPSNLPVRWYYWAENKGLFSWNSLGASDNTDHLKKSDTIEFLGPVDHMKKKIFGRDLFWILGIVEGDLVEMPALSGIWPNTIWAEQVETTKDEILGSSSGEGAQAFALAGFPLISTEVWVREGKPLSNEEEQSFLSDGHSIEYVRDESGKVIDAWVLWKQVDDFYGSEELSRHYSVSATEGRIKFGDGKKGMIPPAGKENIRASYIKGGGEIGNVSVGEIKAFRTPVAGVTSVTNHVPAEGGSDSEDIASALKRGPKMLKSLDRAVTFEDFESLAMASSSAIAKTKCMLEHNSLLVIIIPKSDKAQPEPSSELINIVVSYLKKRMPASLSADDLTVRGPKYREVNIEAEIVPTCLEGAAILEKTISDILKSYLHPLNGGPDGLGWDFGRSVQVSDIYSILEGINGVDHVKKLSLLGLNTEFSDQEIVASAEHKITIMPEVVK